MTRPLRVLLLNQYHPPDTSATAPIVAEVARALARTGHAVTVVAGRPSYRPTARRPWRPWTRERADGWTVEHVGSTTFDRAALPLRALNYLTYVALAGGRALAARADVLVVMTDPPFLVVAAALAGALRHIPVLYNVRDLHPEMAVAAGMIREGVVTRAWRALHRWALRRATTVVVLGDDMRRRILALGVAPARAVVVRDGAWPPGDAAGAAPGLRAAVRGDAAFVVMHAGNLGFAGAFDTVVDAMDAAPAGTALVLVGDGARRAALQRRARARPDVRILDPVPAAQVGALLAAADLQLVTVAEGLDGLVVPSKLYGLLAAGCPVLAVVPEGSDAAALVRETGCGWVADPRDPAAVAAALRAAREDPAALARCAAAAREAAPRFARGPLLAALVAQVERAAGAGR